MTFLPNVNDVLIIGEQPYLIAEHPEAPGVPYGQEGRQAKVFQLIREQDGQRHALKVFNTRFRLPSLVRTAEQLSTFATMPGLSVCQHTVISPRRHRNLLQQHPDLVYAALMPWVDGPSWWEFMQNRRELGREDSLKMAAALVEILVQMEEKGLAHCDLSSSNVLIPGMINGSHGPIQAPALCLSLVDVEQFFGPLLSRPDRLPGGSPGYGHPEAKEGLWCATADRFAGAILIAEMLGWCDKRVRDNRWGESYFEPTEPTIEDRRQNPRFRLLTTVLEEQWGEEVARLFYSAWNSEALSLCPTFGDWMLALPSILTEVKGESVGKNTIDVTDIRPKVDDLIESSRKAATEVPLIPGDALPMVEELNTLSFTDTELSEILLQELEPVESVVPNRVGPIQDQHSAATAAAFAVHSGSGTEYRFAQSPAQIQSTAFSRQRLIAMILGVFVVLGAAAFAAAFWSETLLWEIGDVLKSRGHIAEQASGGGFLALLVGIVQAAVFRRTIRPGRLWVFSAITVIGGLVGGLVGGAFMEANNLDNSALVGLPVGALVGAVAGLVSSLGQNLLLQSQGSAVMWIVWTTISWTVIWSGGWFLIWAIPGIVGVATTAAVVLVAHGVALVTFLHGSPDVEF